MTVKIIIHQSVLARWCCDYKIMFYSVTSPPGQQCESNTEFWTDESTRCLCSAGQLSCSPSRCPEGQICGPQRSPSGGISTSGMCTIHSNTDCSTFDGVLFRFMAPCTYTLAKTCSPAGALPVFSVAVVNEQNGNASLPAVRQVIVEIGNLRVSLLRRQTDRVVVSYFKLRRTHTGGQLQMYKASVWSCNN